MRTTAICLLTCALALLTACGDSADGSGKIDTSTPESLNKTLAAARTTLAPERQAEFDKAVLYLSSPKMGALFARPDAVQAEYLATINGLTAEGVIAAAKKDGIDRAVRMHESTAAVNLRTGLLLAEKTFAKGGYNDQDKDGTLRSPATVV